jgi:hypothetical protein
MKEQKYGKFFMSFEELARKLTSAYLNQWVNVNTCQLVIQGSSEAWKGMGDFF